MALPISRREPVIRSGRGCAHGMEHGPGPGQPRRHIRKPRPGAREFRQVRARGSFRTVLEHPPLLLDQGQQLLHPVEVGAIQQAGVAGAPGDALEFRSLGLPILQGGQGTLDGLQ